MRALAILLSAAIYFAASRPARAQDAAPATVDLQAAPEPASIESATPAPSASPDVPELSRLDEAFKQTSIGKAADEFRQRVAIRKLQNRVNNDADIIAAKRAAESAGTDLAKRERLRSYYDLYYGRMHRLASDEGTKKALDEMKASHVKPSRTAARSSHSRCFAAAGAEKGEKETEKVALRAGARNLEAFCFCVGSSDPRLWTNNRRMNNLAGISNQQAVGNHFAAENRLIANLNGAPVCHENSLEARIPAETNGVSFAPHIEKHIVPIESSRENDAGIISQRKSMADIDHEIGVYPSLQGEDRIPAQAKISEVEDDRFARRTCNRESLILTEGYEIERPVGVEEDRRSGRRTRLKNLVAQKKVLRAEPTAHNRAGQGRP